MQNKTPYNLLVITGPTASGKTKLAARVAKKINGEIISADSRQVYRRMNLGTGKDYDDYLIDDKEIPYHLIDLKEPGYKYNVYEYQNDFFNIFDDIHKRDKFPVMCGGTGLYIQAVLDQYKMVHVPPDRALREKLKDKSLKELTDILASFKKLHNTTDTDTVKRAIRSIEIETYYQNHPEIEVKLPEVKPLLIGVRIDRSLRREKITRRLKERLDEGMVEEVKGLIKEGIKPEDLIYYGLEYKFLTQHVTGEISYNEMFEKLNIAIHQFAKRQMTWFRGMERKGHKIHWIDARGNIEDNVADIVRMLTKTD
ncbi:tRNA (adenosine(37)-N6)-dimethylallyltransferase MiaA [Marinilabilia rubra]|uniref:tRNA dimethylallyltransferase n=1 Tax=Marinilabilia rubra TaxID=2162893 RepID=A0A2U2B9R2_9BACT|nr:tRNA (adenosine(37)-N6)-dimethylallyltransferase MiaA [Marinilabilia rubra]PWD99783.1 tRNA (adenosine(37)-N6)-dimethylallyltransferase MiaA [Marinilabilia rubra]